MLDEHNITTISDALVPQAEESVETQHVSDGLQESKVYVARKSISKPKRSLDEADLEENNFDSPSSSPGNYCLVFVEITITNFSTGSKRTRVA